ncbi:MFS transporter [Candidatus Sumerlaeota bacterium]|nr:MFS transporter [Candidatus Sumerlaeota bacterium]
MKRTHLYYILSVAISCCMVGGLLNSQLIIVERTPQGTVSMGRELLLYSWGVFVYALGSLSLSWLSDKYGRVRCIGVVTLVLTILHGILGWNLLGSYKVWHLFLYWGVFNICLSIFFTAVEGLLSEYQDHRIPLARRLGAYCLSWCAGNALGSFITGYTKERSGAHTVYRVLFILCLAAFLAVLLDWRRHGSSRLGHHAVDHKDIRPDTLFYTMLGRIGLFFSCLVWGALASSFPRFGRDFHHLSEGGIGNLLGTIFFTNLMVFLWFPFWKKWQYNAPLQIALQSATPAGLILAIFTPSGSILLLRIAFVLIGIGWSISYFFSIYYSLMVPTDHAKSGGLHEGFLSLGSLSGSLAVIGLIPLAAKMNLIDPERLGAVALLTGFLGMILSLYIQTALLKRRQKRIVPDAY